MTRYLELGTGKELNSNDSNRGIWYSAGNCGYWTDDWDKLNCEGIPACPFCGAVGMQTDWSDWKEGAQRHEKEGNPYYWQFCLEEKEKCNREVTWEEKYRIWYASRRMK